MKHDRNVTYVRVRDGRELSADEAFNSNGLLKSGVSMRTSLQFMDSVPKSGFHIAAGRSALRATRPHFLPTARALRVTGHISELLIVLPKNAWRRCASPSTILMGSVGVATTAVEPLS